jgi:hypothetical protein
LWFGDAAEFWSADVKSIAAIDTRPFVEIVESDVAVVVVLSLTLE